MDEMVEVTVGMIADGSCWPGQPSSIKRLSGTLIVRNPRRRGDRKHGQS
jgi:hypothetical protein